VPVDTRGRVRRTTISALLAGAMGWLLLGHSAGAGEAAKNGWHTYRNARAGYSVKYPPRWTAHDQVSAGGQFVTLFTSPDRASAIEISVRPETTGQGDPSDIPHTRCHAVTMSGLSGTQCVDTISFSAVTTLVAGGKVYSIAWSLKRMKSAIAQRFVRSFRLLS